MTREEAIKVIRKMLAYTDLSVRANLTADMVDACHLAIKALEQEPILEKIRAEIQDIAFDSQEIDGEHESIMILELNDALNIIDKHKAKSEVEDGECK